MRLTLYVRPGASSTKVGGTFDGALLVRVAEPAERGRATAAAMAALAEALAISPARVRLVRGATSRRKVVELEVDEEHAGALSARLAVLRAASSPGDARG